MERNFGAPPAVLCETAAGVQEVLPTKSPRGRLLLAMPLHAPLRAALVAALLTLACAGTAQASARAPMYFDAGTAAVRDDTRAATLDRLDGLGVRALRITLVWAAVAPDAGSATRPAFDARDPQAYDWGGYGRLVDAAHARGRCVLITFIAPVPCWAPAAHRYHEAR